MKQEQRKSIARIRIPVLKKLIKKYQKEIDKHTLVLSDKHSEK